MAYRTNHYELPPHRHSHLASTYTHLGAVAESSGNPSRHQTIRQVFSLLRGKAAKLPIIMMYYPSAQYRRFQRLTYPTD